MAAPAGSETFLFDELAPAAQEVAIRLQRDRHLPMVREMCLAYLEQSSGVEISRFDLVYDEGGGMEFFLEFSGRPAVRKLLPWRRFRRKSRSSCRQKG